MLSLILEIEMLPLELHLQRITTRKLQCNESFVGTSQSAGLGIYKTTTDFLEMIRDLAIRPPEEFQSTYI